MQREYITNEAWMKIFSFFKTINEIYIGHEDRLRRFFEGVYWMNRAGAQWRLLPPEYGNWNSVFKRFNRLSKKGIWEKLFYFCQKDSDLEFISIDSTIVRAHACAAGYGDAKEQGLGRSCGGFSTKIHVKCEALGLPLTILITQGQTSDITQAKALLGNTVGTYGLADRGYDSDDFRQALINQNCTPVIPGKSNRLKPIEYDKHIYKERHVVECFFSKIKYFRRVFSRYDKSICNYRSFVLLAGVHVWLR